MSIDYSRYRYYQNIQVWPKTTELNYEGWLENFDEGEERELAKQILDYFVYIPEDMVNQLFKTVVGRVGYHFREKDTTWNNDSFKNDCWYSYVPGEIPNKSDSGGIFARKVRDVLDVDENRILEFKDLISELESTSTPQRVILTDDFVGSGHQCVEAWNNDSLFNEQTKSLKDVAEKGFHQIVYAPLVVNYLGANRIFDECKGLELECIYLLGIEHDLFSNKCPCWKGDDGLYAAGKDLILRKSKEQGIDDNGGVQSVKGYMNQGLALAFSHGIPDACPAFFYWQNDNWLPLMKKHFNRQ